MSIDATTEEPKDVAGSPPEATEDAAEQVPTNKKPQEFQRRALSALKRARTFSPEDAEAGMDREVLLVQAQVYAMLSISSALSADPGQG